jgi:hypothetical protein
MLPLFCIIYTSIATQPMGAHELDLLLVQAREHNAPAGVTGLLLYDNGQFMQYLEGPADGLSEVLARIRASSRHGGLVELMRDRISRREFPDWAMAFRSPQAFVLSDPGPQSDLLAPVGSDDWRAKSPAGFLLAAFWNRGRLSRSF